MYAIATVIYGIPLIKQERVERILDGHDCSYIRCQDRSEQLDEFLEEHDGLDGLITPYSGAGGYVPAAFGVELDGFDEACHHVELLTLKLAPTVEQKQEYQKKWDALSENAKAIMSEFGEPRVFLLWSTS